MTENKSVEIYTIVITGVDADRGSFPDPIIHGSYASKEIANEVMDDLIVSEKESLDDRYNREERDEYHWEMYADGYAAACFVRIDILESRFHF